MFITRTHNIINDRCLVIQSAENNEFRRQRRSRHTESSHPNSNKGIELATPIQKWKVKSGEILEWNPLLTRNDNYLKNDKWLHNENVCVCVYMCVFCLIHSKDWNSNLRVLHKYVHEIDAISLFNWRRRHCVIVIVKRGPKKKSLHQTQTRASKCVPIDYMLFSWERGLKDSFFVSGFPFKNWQEVAFHALWKFVTCRVKSLNMQCWWDRIICRDSTY